MNKYIQNKLDKERFSDAKQAATMVFNYVLKSDYSWPYSTDDTGHRIKGWGNVIPDELVELLLMKKLELSDPKQTKYKAIQKKFDEQFPRFQEDTKQKAEDEIRGKRHFTLYTLGAILIVTFFLILSYFMNWGVFQHDVTLNGNDYFSISMPGNYKKEMVTLGTADAPLFRNIYIYDNQAENNRVIFTVTQNIYPAAFSDKQINDLFFIQAPENGLIQNYGSAAGSQRETLQEKTSGIYVGYPSIDAIVTVDNLSITRYIRYVRIGHIVYEISMAEEDCSGNECKDLFNKYANTFKILLTDKIKAQ